MTAKYCYWLLFLQIILVFCYFSLLHASFLFWYGRAMLPSGDKSYAIERSTQAGGIDYAIQPRSFPLSRRQHTGTFPT